MDRLDQVLDTARPLLQRVDEVLSLAGAPAGHDMWAELRRVRLLPGDAAQAVAALRPTVFVEAVPELRADARACAQLAGSLPPPDEWTGEAADAYEDVRRRAAAHLGGGGESLDERLEATADLAQALTEWMQQTRTGLAVTLAGILDSGEAVTLSGSLSGSVSDSLSGSFAGSGATMPPPAAEVLAAAEVAAHVLRSVADNYDHATDLLHGSAQLATATPM
ncbi:hypothetical protein ACWKSP_24990 [Micromonosporaceae bacterium Da 78-11]